MNKTISIHSVAELLAHAKTIEQEAMERYEDLAEQMEVHHNRDVAALFRKMVAVESKHVQKILERAGDADLPNLSPWEYQWLDDEAPEAVVATDVHYLMTPHHALQLALQAEQRSFDFFSHVAQTDAPDAVRALAQELCEEERDHIKLMEDWLARTPEPDDGWDHDPDPPMLQE